MRSEGQGKDLTYQGDVDNEDNSITMKVRGGRGFIKPT